MSTKKTLRKRPVKVETPHHEIEGRSTRKKLKEKAKTELSEATPVNDKQKLVAPNGKIFYPCQYCIKIFPQKKTSINHMKKCPNKNQILTLSDVNTLKRNREKYSEHQEYNTEFEETPVKIEKCSDLNSSGSSTENMSPMNKIKISQIITVKSSNTKKQETNTSIYDYDEQDPEEKELKEKNEKAKNMNSCKHCDSVFENPLDLLRHTRELHSFPKTILPPNEIEKYFDSPNRDFCPICKKPIKTHNFRSIFIKHLLVHTTGLTHECRICKKKFRRKDHMRIHEKRHIVSV